MDNSSTNSEQMTKLLAMCQESLRKLVRAEKDLESLLPSSSKVTKGKNPKK